VDGARQIDGREGMSATENWAMALRGAKKAQGSRQSSGIFGDFLRNPAV
jgi:hypothetical protein